MKLLIILVLIFPFKVICQINNNDDIFIVRDHYYNNEFINAIKVADSLLKTNTLNKNDIESVLIWKLDCQYSLKMYFESLQTLQKLPNVEKNFSLLKHRADCKLKLKDYFGAIEDYSSSLSIIKYESSQNIIQIEIFFSRAECYFKLGKYELAVLDYSSVINFPNNISENLSEAYLFRGLARVYLNKKEEACKDFSKALENGSKVALDAITEHCK